MRPDVTFGDLNDRFDITSIIDEQNRFYNMNKDYRRKPEKKVHNKEGIGGAKEDNVLNALRDVFRSIRRSETDFAYHDAMKDEENGNMADFEENLEKLKREGDEKKKLENIVSELHGGEEISGRRSRKAMLEDELLLHYAFPVLMKVKGYLQLPLTS